MKFYTVIALSTIAISLVQAAPFPTTHPAGSVTVHHESSCLHGHCEYKSESSPPSYNSLYPPKQPKSPGLFGSLWNRLRGNKQTTPVSSSFHSHHSSTTTTYHPHDHKLSEKDHNGQPHLQTNLAYSKKPTRGERRAERQRKEIEAARGLGKAPEPLASHAAQHEHGSQETPKLSRKERKRQARLNGLTRDGRTQAEVENAKHSAALPGGDLF